MVIKVMLYPPIEKFSKPSSKKKVSSVSNRGSRENARNQYCLCL
jgi:hypothetical protein